MMPDKTPTIEPYVPSMTRRKSGALHECTICKIELAEGERVMMFVVSKLYNNYIFNYCHLGCWLNKNIQLQEILDLAGGKNDRTVTE